MRLVPGILCVSVALAACGEPSAQEERAAWARDADAICAKAQRSIAERGAPTGPGDFIEVSKAGAADLREVVDDVLAIEVPKEAARDLRTIRDVLREARPELDDLARLGPRATIGKVTVLVEAFDVQSEDLAPAARKAGLKACGDEKQIAAALDGMKGPLFEIRFSGFADLLRRKLAGHRERGTGSVEAAGAALTTVRTEMGYAQIGLDKLLPPTWAEEAFDRYQDAVLAFRADVKRANEPFRDKKATPADAREAMARLARGEAKLSAAARELQRTLRQELRGGRSGEAA